MSDPIIPPIFLAKFLRRLLPQPEVPPTMEPVKANTPNRARDPQRVLDERGILPQQASRNPIVSEMVYNGVIPRAYWSNFPGENYGRWKTGLSVLTGRDFAPDRTKFDTPDREDAWRMFLGLPQENGTFAISPYRPTRGRGDNTTYYRYNGVEENLKATAGNAPTLPYAIRDLRKMWEENEEKPLVKFDSVVSTATGNYIDPNQSIWGLLTSGGTTNERGVMGEFTIDFGEDENGPYLSIYDRWDLGRPRSPTKKMSERVGKPFEIYDRIYYDPKTFHRRFPGTAEPDSEGNYRLDLKKLLGTR